jgi:hypothetical protein
MGYWGETPICLNGSYLVRMAVKGMIDKKWFTFASMITLWTTVVQVFIQAVHTPWIAVIW